MKAGTNLRSQAIERTKREIQDPWGVWGITSFYQVDQQSCMRQGVLRKQAKARLEVLNET